MKEILLLREAFLLAILFAAAVSDIRHRTIPNVLPAAFLPPGIAFRILAPQNTNPYSMACLAPVLVSLWLFWRRGKLGGGDVKLFFGILFLYPSETGLRLVAGSLAAGLVMGIFFRLFGKKTEYPLAPGMFLAAVREVIIHGGLL